MPDPFAWLGDVVAFSLFGLSLDSATGAALHFFVMDVAKIFALLVLVIYAMGLLRALVSPERVRELVRGRPDWQARGMAVGLGAVTPFCSCSSVPLFIGFVEAGIPLGVTFSFLIASPMINEVAAVLLIGILGWKLALLYIGAGLVVAWFGGIIMQRFRPERWVEDYVWKIHMRETAAPRPDTSLRGEMDQRVGAVFLHQLMHHAGRFDPLGHGAEPGGLHEAGLPAFLERDVVIVGEAIDADHLPPVGQEPPAEVIADEARRPRDECALACHHSVPPECGPEIHAQELAHISSSVFSVLKPSTSAALSARAT